MSEEIKSPHKSPANAGGSRDKEGKFLPGASGNPKGGHQGSISLTAMLRKALEKIVKTEKGKKKARAQILIDMIVEKALTGKDFATIWNIINRIEGFPKQAINLGPEEGITIIFKDAEPNGESSPKDESVPKEPPGVPTEEK